ncbi:hypothetical protein PBY51_001939 [Eleginops maclovinus]|uniref:Uncharacterized protein n=1 Tax=Eleginops maclovinus TaxID=56733 RepID=A0AAN7WWZ9_ELEMC|nr:hypothetical protein PBY51_001939 [Eleginops maclovinus]
MKYEAVSYPNLWLEKMKTDSTDVSVGPQIKGHPGSGQRQPPLTSLSALNVLELESTRQHEERGTFFKYLKGIYTPAQWEVEEHRGVGARLWFRPPKKQNNFNPSDSLIDTIQGETKTELCKHLHIHIQTPVAGGVRL